MPELPEPSFIMIVQLHHLQAMLSLGLIANPATGQPQQPDFGRARHELALLEILKEKTEGNLNADESKLLEEIIIAIKEALASQ